MKLELVRHAQAAELWVARRGTSNMNCEFLPHSPVRTQWPHCQSLSRHACMHVPHDLGQYSVMKTGFSRHLPASAHPAH